MTTNDATTEPPSSASPADHAGPQHFEIRVEGHLEARWAAWFDGLTLVGGSDGTTVIRGPLVDQAALHGVLQRLRDVGIPLVSLTPISPDTTTTSTPPEPTLRHHEGN